MFLNVVRCVWVTVGYIVIIIVVVRRHRGRTGDVDEAASAFVVTRQCVAARMVVAAATVNVTVDDPNPRD